jgi:hypothetical protein
MDFMYWDCICFISQVISIYTLENPNHTLVYLTAIMFFEFCLFNQLWGGGLQNNLFSIMYVLFNGLRFVR